MWALIDNYDSFTHILHHYLLQTGDDCRVYRNDELSLQQLIELRPERLIISPGPETPLQSGISMPAIDHFHDKIPILGVCLGHQAIGMYFGAELSHAPYPMHGKTSNIKHDGSPLFKNLPENFSVMRYHSLVLQQIENTPLIPAAYSTDDSQLMALYHPVYRCVGVQFHPESIGTEHGLSLLRNWSDMYR